MTIFLILELKMNKLQMAHEYMVAWLKSGNAEPNSAEELAEFFFSIADAMQAEADKREKEEAEKKRKEMRELLNADNTFVEKEGQHFDDVEEWQPDWSKAPDWAVAWTIDSTECLWWSYTPRFKNNFWFVDDSISWKCDYAPSFGYTGDWRNSLRKRPE